MSSYLRKSIMSTLLIAGAASTHATPVLAETTLPPVNGWYYPIPMSPYDRCSNPIDNSCMGDAGGSVYDGDTNHDGDGDGGGDYDFEAERIEHCGELTEKGLPSFCNRPLATSGTPAPNLQVPSSLSMLFSYAPGRVVAQQREALAQLSLSACYANVSIPPSECESRYALAVRDLWAGISINSQSQAYLDDAVANLLNRFVNTESGRYWAGFFSNTSLGFSFYNIGFESSLLSWPFEQGQYNQALVAAREQKLCDFWYSRWDIFNCSSL
jgi:hypothetical protein